MAPAELDWLDEAATLPLAFAQVREDVLADLWVADQLPQGARVMMVASGGCTAAALACRTNLAQLHLVDVNRAQLNLTRLKLDLLDAPSEFRRSVLGHSPLPTETRRAALEGLLLRLDLPLGALGPIERLAEWGPDYAGRYERLFVALRQAFGPRQCELDEVLSQDDPSQQSLAVAPASPLGMALDDAFDRILSHDILVRLFGKEATNNPVEPFSRHFARRTRHVLATLPAGSNPYLWQMLAGSYSAGVAAPWISMKPAAVRPGIVFHQMPMLEALAGQRGEYDFLHLSNILDWLDEEQAAEALELAWRALRPGGWALVRQLNSSIEVRRLCERFAWNAEQSSHLHAKDRSFFYRELHLGQRL